MLELSHVTKYGKNFALKDISFQVPSGYITGLVGKNGAGKSTLMRVILDVLRRDEGTILLDGYDNVKAEEAFRDRVGFVSESGEPFLMEFSARQNGDMLGQSYSRWQQEKFLSNLTSFGLNRQMTEQMKLSQLSRGQFIRFQLAFALAHEPTLLLLDEPTANLDPVFRIKFLHVLQALIEQEETAVLFATHITTDLDKIGDYVVVLHRGRVYEDGAKDDLLAKYQCGKLSEVILKVTEK